MWATVKPLQPFQQDLLFQFVDVKSAQSCWGTFCPLIEPFSTEEHTFVWSGETLGRGWVLFMSKREFQLSLPQRTLKDVLHNVERFWESLSLTCEQWQTSCTAAYSAKEHENQEEQEPWEQRLTKCTTWRQILALQSTQKNRDEVLSVTADWGLNTQI